MKKLSFITAILIILLTTCRDPAGGSSDDPNNPVNPGQKTIIVFDNTQGICAVTVYSSYLRGEESKIAQIPEGRLSEEIEWLPGAITFFFSYQINFKGISGFSVDYVPIIGKDQTNVRVDPNIKNTITIPPLAEALSSADTLLSDKSYLLIQNNSSYSLLLLRGDYIIPPDNVSETLVNPGERAQYTVNPEAASAYQLLVGWSNIPFPSSFVSFEAGWVYSFVYNNGVLSLTSEIELKLDNVVIDIPWPSNEIPAIPEKPVIISEKNQLTVTWRECGGASFYEVYINTTTTTPSTPAVTSDKTSVVINNLQNDVIYYVWVRAVNSAGKSGYSPVETGIPRIPTVVPAAPAAPGSPVLSAGSRELSVSWQAVELASAYEVWFGTSDDLAQAQKYGGDIVGGVTETIITGLTNETTYYVWIKAKNVVGTSDFSLPASAKPYTVDRLPGLYRGNVKIGDYNLSSSLSYISTYAVSGDNYFIILGVDESVSPMNLDYSGKTVGITLIGYDGERKITLASDGSMFTINAGVTLTIEENISLIGSYSNASLINVFGTLIMNGGKISDNYSRGGRGGGINIDNDGTFTMNGGTISGNTTQINSNDYSYGGGVYVGIGIFTMNGGAINGNTVASSGGINSSVAGRGGGVSVQGGTFTMNGGTISGNTANASNSGQFSSNYSYGGGVYVGIGIFTMNGGSISGNTANVSNSGYNSNGGSRGGGVCVHGTFTMNNGIISGNTANVSNIGSGRGSSYGGGVSVEGETFIMNNGTISENTASVNGSYSSSYGGGVSVVIGIFTMYDGVISGNNTKSSDEDNYGGGVFVNNTLTGTEVNYRTFTMHGGVISGNTAGTGGGIVVYNVSNSFKKLPLSEGGQNSGIIYGNEETGVDEEGIPLKNTASGDGHAVYFISYPTGYPNAELSMRNTTAGQTDYIDTETGRGLSADGEPPYGE